MMYLATPSIHVYFLSSSSTGELSALSQSETMFVELGESSQNMLSEAFWTPNIASSQFDEYSELYSRSKSLPNKEPTIFAEYSQPFSRTKVRPIKDGLQGNQNFDFPATGNAGFLKRKSGSGYPFYRAMQDQDSFREVRILIFSLQGNAGFPQGSQDLDFLFTGQSMISSITVFQQVIPTRVNISLKVSTHKGVNWRSKYITQVQQQRPKSPRVTLTWHSSRYKVHKLYQRYIHTNSHLACE